jgi:hypothetical protein
MMRQTWPPLAVGLVLASLAGCAATEEMKPVPTATADGVVFTGPWAKEFADAYRQATLPFSRAALRDGKITDQEFAEMEERFRSCLAESSVGFEGFGPGGGFETTNLNGVSTSDNAAAIERCSPRSGNDDLNGLYFWVKGNPENLDFESNMAACLVRKKVVAPGYTAADYEADLSRPSYSFTTDEDTGLKAVQVCTYDPLGLIGEE